MELSELGYDLWFQEKREQLGRPDCRIARITRVDRDRYMVRNELDEVKGELTGRMLFGTESSQDLPCVGDWVLVQYVNEGAFAVIHDLLPRKTFLRRKAAGKNVDYQMIASNIDHGLIVHSCGDELNLRSIERYLVLVNEGHIEPIILLSKSDLASAEDLQKRLAEIRLVHGSAGVIPFSNVTPGGLAVLEQSLKRGRTYCLLGPSGVGKTTLLNRLLGEDVFETNQVREKDGRGRHTTARRQLTVLDNGALLVDTPGLRELGMIAVGESIEESFSEIHRLAKGCRFNDCTHTTEDGCAILLAVKTGEVSLPRYRSYIKLKKESAFHQLSYIQRRKKDRQFGRMIKSAKKQMRRK
jgi:ribosome biogenesis GTPase / thiamine phosphate phosphatase